MTFCVYCQASHVITWVLDWQAWIHSWLITCCSHEAHFLPMVFSGVLCRCSHLCQSWEKNWCREFSDNIAVFPRNIRKKHVNFSIKSHSIILSTAFLPQFNENSKKLKLRIFLLDHIKDTCNVLFWESPCCFKICFLGSGNLFMVLSPLLSLPHRSLLSQNFEIFLQDAWKQIAPCEALSRRLHVYLNDHTTGFLRRLKR